MLQPMRMPALHWKTHLRLTRSRGDGVWIAGHHFLAGPGAAAWIYRMRVDGLIS